MHRTSVTSTALRSVGYDGEADVLEVEFTHGGVYRYIAVPRVVYDGLLAADSLGTYFDEYVRKAGYNFERVL